MPCRAPLAVVLASCLLKIAGAAAPMRHKWDKVADMMAVHGKFKQPTVTTELPTEQDIAFVANNYAMATIYTSCPRGDVTTEDSVLDVARGIKAVNPSVKVGMYWRTMIAVELGRCSHFREEWRNNTAWRLKDDAGNVVRRGWDYYYDYLNPDAWAFFARALVSVTKAKLPSGEPVLDYLYIDGVPVYHPRYRYLNGIGQERTNQLLDALYLNFAEIQRQLDEQGYGQSVILNGMDRPDSADRHVATGVAGSMFDHWSMMEFVDRSNGGFNIPMMEMAIDLMQGPVLSSSTIQVKGWPGPIIKQRNIFPPNMEHPGTQALKREMILERFNTELALFLLVAEDKDWWTYSWFWDWYDFVPSHDTSTLPDGFFPEAKCALGAPAGPAQKVQGTKKYTRQFKHASVFVDLNNRSASRVDFVGCSHQSSLQARAV